MATGILLALVIVVGVLVGAAWRDARQRHAASLEQGVLLAQGLDWCQRGLEDCHAAIRQTHDAVIALRPFIAAETDREIVQTAQSQRELADQQAALQSQVNEHMTNAHRTRVEMHTELRAVRGGQQAHAMHGPIK